MTLLLEFDKTLSVEITKVIDQNRPDVVINGNGVTNIFCNILFNKSSTYSSFTNS